MDDDRDELERYRYNCPNVVNFIRMLGVLAERPGEITPSEPDLGNASEGKRKMCMRFPPAPHKIPELD